MNKEGLVEVDLGSFSLEPFLYTDGELITWADAEVTQELVDGYLPIPSSLWRKDDLLLRITVFADGAPGPPAVWVRYRIENTGTRARRPRLAVTVRPFQVTPPWQAFHGLGGVSPIHELSCTSDGAWVNGGKAVVSLTAASQVGAAAFDQGAIAEFLTRGEIPPTAHIRDSFGYASAALCFDLELAAAGAAEVYVAVPFGSQTSATHQLAELRTADGAQRLAARHLSYIPGSVEWADFDPTATSTAIVTTDAADRLPAAALVYTYDEYLAGLRKRRRGEIDWNNYTAYEIRNVGALLRLGRRDDAHELLCSLVDDRRPAAWNQWPEITWREPSSQGHIGDIPHAWIGAEYVLAALSLFADERETDQALVIAAGIPRGWIEDEAGVVVRDLPTRYGRVSFTLQRDASGGLRLDLHGPLAVPPGKIVLRPPLETPLRRVEVNGSVVTRFQTHEVTIDSVPASVVMG